MKTMVLVAVAQDNSFAVAKLAASYVSGVNQKLAAIEKLGLGVGMDSSGNEVLLRLNSSGELV